MSEPDYGSPLWVAEFRRAYPGADVIGRLGRLLVLRFADGVIAKAVGGSASAPTVMALSPAELVQFRRGIQREAGADVTPGTQTGTGDGVPVGKAIALAIGGAVIWGGVAAAGAKLSDKHPALGAGLATGLLSLIGVGVAASVPIPKLGATVYSDEESYLAEAEAEKAIRRRMVLQSLGVGIGATGGATGGAALAKRHPATGAAVGAVGGGLAGSLAGFALARK